MEILHLFRSEHFLSLSISLTDHLSCPNGTYDLFPLNHSIVSQDGKLPAAILDWDLHPQREYQFCECSMLKLDSQMEYHLFLKKHNIINYK